MDSYFSHSQTPRVLASSRTFPWLLFLRLNSYGLDPEDVKNIGWKMGRGTIVRTL